MSDIISRKRMSAKELVNAEASKIEFIPNPQRGGELFFTCGSYQAGYISPAVKQKFAEGTLTIADMQFAECSTDDGTTWIPCLMLVGKKVKPVATFE